MKNLKTIGLSSALTLILSIVLKLFVSKLITAIILAALIVIVGIVLIKTKEEKSKIISVVASVVISIALSLLLSKTLIISIAAIILSLIIAEKLPEKCRAISWVILIAVVLTWILPITSLSYGELVSDGTKSQLGLFDLFSYGNITIQYFGVVALYVFAIGGFYGVLNKTSGYRKLLDSMNPQSTRKKSIVLSIIMVVFSIIASITCGEVRLLLFVPFIISLVLIMGYDKITAAVVALGPIAVGTIGTTISSTLIESDGYSESITNSMGVLNSLLGTSFNTNIVLKIIVLLLGIAALIAYLFVFANKNISEKTKEEAKELIPEVIENKNNKSKSLVSKIVTAVLFDFCLLILFIPLILLVKAKVVKIILFVIVCLILALVIVFTILKLKEKAYIPIAYILGSMAIITMLSLMSWTSVLNINWYTTATNTILQNIKISEFPIIGKLLGTIAPFEQWDYIELIVMMFIATVAIAVSYKVKISDIIEGIGNGFKKALNPAIMVVLAYLVLVIVNINPFVLTINKPILELTKGINAFTMPIVVFISNLFNVESLYSANNIVPYALQLYPKATGEIQLIWQTMIGFTAFVAPTSLILMPVLSYLGIPYCKWIKKTLPLIGVLFGICIIASFIVVVF